MHLKAESRRVAAPEAESTGNGDLLLRLLHANTDADMVITNIFTDQYG
jgi:hypothetical protein